MFHPEYEDEMWLGCIDLANDMSDEEVIEYARNHEWLDQNFDTEEFIIPTDLSKLRDKIADFEYWELWSANDRRAWHGVDTRYDKMD